MGSYSFKSAGKTEEQKIIESLNKSPTPIGIITPVRQGNSSIFATTYSLSEQVHYNLRDLILTNWGERLALYDYGANLRELTSEFTTQDDFDSMAIERINNAVSKWMPYISLNNFVSEVNRKDNVNTAIINITITYDVPNLQIKDKALLVTLYVI